MKILLVEDSEKLTHSLILGLQQEGHTVDSVSDGITAEQHILTPPQDYDVIILDMMLPGRDGLTICQNVRTQQVITPILMLTAKDSVQDRVAGLNSGADDYLIKPFSFVELTARLSALSRRPKTLIPITLTVGPLTLNTTSMQARCNNQFLILTLKEFHLLEVFMHHPNEVLTRERLLTEVWNNSHNTPSNIVDVHIKNLRKKLNQHQHDHSLLATVRGLGYRLTN